MITRSEIESTLRNRLGSLIPRNTIYQYAKFDVALNEIILKQSLQFSDPRNFNDPFDCNEKLLKIDFNEEIVENIISELQERHSRQEIRLLRKRLQNPKYQHNLLKEKRLEYKIACFSQRNDEILMWSHYADKHTGICVGFDFPYKYSEKFILCPVNYLTEIKPIEGITDVNRSILYWLTTKSIRWEYEKEIRAITKAKNKNQFEYRNFDKSSIKEIIFGCCVSDKIIRDTINSLKKNNIDYCKIKISRMKIDENNFLLKEKIIRKEDKTCTITEL